MDIKEDIDSEIDDLDDTDTEFETKHSLESTVVDNNCCRNKCLLMFDDDFKSSLKSKLSALQSMEKKIYLFAMISINETQKSLKKSAKSSKYYEYTVKEYGIHRSVCKSAFIILHDTTPAMVRSLCEKMSINCLIPTDQRGKHVNQPTISEHTKKMIKSHFCDTLQSPDIFKCVKKRYGQPNIHQLWIDFRRKYGHLSRASYSKYVGQVITPEVLHKFMCANEAKLILDYLKTNDRQLRKLNN